ncbi:MAG: hypothetical protein WC768_02315 [Patescibacteria group bacterium]|jgi:hypothetical protein
MKKSANLQKFIILASSAVTVITVTFFVANVILAAWQGPTDYPPQGNVAGFILANPTTVQDASINISGAATMNRLNVMGEDSAIGGSLTLNGDTSIVGKSLTVTNDGKICFDLDCIASWSEVSGGAGGDLFWAGSGNNIYTLNSGNVGIASNPMEKLQITDAFAFHSGGHKVFAFGWAPSLNKALMTGKPAEIRWIPTTGGLFFGTDSSSRNSGDTANVTTKMILSADGSLGIGTTPQNILHLNSSDTNNKNFAITLTNSGNTAGKRGYRLAFDNDRLTFQKADDSGNWLADQVAIKQDTGYVGIGTINPKSLLSVGWDGLDSNWAISARKDTGSGDWGAIHGYSTQGVGVYGWASGRSVQNVYQNAGVVGTGVNNATGGFFQSVNSSGIALIAKNAADGTAIWVPSGKVGIGTATPQNILHLNTNDTNNKNFAIVLTNAGNTVGNKGYRLAFDNDRLTFQKADDSGNWLADQVAIKQDTGDVGIGTVNPAVQFEVSSEIPSSPSVINRGALISQHYNDSAAATLQLRKSRGTNDFPTAVNSTDYVGGLWASAYDGSKYQQAAAIGFAVNGPVSNTSVPLDIVFSTKPTGAVSIIDGEKMRITSVGNVGIGTSAPTDILHLAKSTGPVQLKVEYTGTESSGSTAFSAVQLANANGAKGYLSLAGSNYTINGLVQPNGVYLQAMDNTAPLVLMTRGTANPIIFATAGYAAANERMRITSTGRVGIGTITPRTKLDIWAGDLVVTGTDTNGTAYVTSRGGVAYYGNNAYNNGLAINPSGNVGIGTATPSTKLDVNGNANVSGNLNINGTLTCNGGACGGQSGYGTWTASGNNIYNSNTGYVGIGTSSPTSPLHVKQIGGFVSYVMQYHANNQTPWLAGFYNDTYSATVPAFEYFAWDTGDFTMGSPAAKNVSIYTGGYNNPRLTITGAGNVVIPGNLQVGGTKNFVQDHPTDPTKQILYYSLEGGESGTYTRGSGQLANGEATINLPEHFSLVTSDQKITVQITPTAETSGLYVASKNNKQIKVKELANGKSNVTFDYLVQGERKGHENAPVIVDKETVNMAPTPEQIKAKNQNNNNQPGDSGSGLQAPPAGASIGQVNSEPAAAGESAPPSVSWWQKIVNFFKGLVRK